MRDIHAEWIDCEIGYMNLTKLPVLKSIKDHGLRAQSCFLDHES